MLPELVLQRPGFASWRQPYSAFRYPEWSQNATASGDSQTRLAFPGIPRERIEVSVSGRIVVVSIREEGEGGEFKTRYRLQLRPGDDAESVEASYADGLLTISVREVASARRIVPLG
jgi:HSP20 family molecular chaperone IbpA